MQKYSKNYKPFRYFDGVTRAMVDRENRKPKQALSEAMRLSLVKSTISTTSQRPVENDRDLTIYEPVKEIDELRQVFSAETKGPGRFTMLQQRTWSGEYRVRTRVETMSQRPPINDGPRVSRTLSTRGQRKIRESCYYMAECHGGYKTFVTGTFTEDVRQRISMRKTTIQKEISRTMDALQKMYKRGWIMASGKRVAGNSKPLAYCWVVEVPLNKAGEENPHVHLLIDWQVEKSLFQEWSSRIESIWGNGYFHLEKIRDPKCAGAYMAKAAGYLTKANNQSDQGTVIGNRYGISKSARAPGWSTIHEAELGIMGRLITDFYNEHVEKWSHLYEQKQRLVSILKLTSRSNWQLRNKAKAELKDIQEKIRKIPVVASQYQLIFKSSGEFYRFLGKAIGLGWDINDRPSSQWLAEFDRRLNLKRESERAWQMRWTDLEWNSVFSHYQTCQDLNEEELPGEEKLLAQYLVYCQ